MPRRTSVSQRFEIEYFSGLNFNSGGETTATTFVEFQNRINVIYPASTQIPHPCSDKSKRAMVSEHASAKKKLDAVLSQARNMFSDGVTGIRIVACTDNPLEYNFIDRLSYDNPLDSSEIVIIEAGMWLGGSKNLKRYKMPRARPAPPRRD